MAKAKSSEIAPVKLDPDKILANGI